MSVSDERQSGEAPVPELESKERRQTSGFWEITTRAVSILALFISALTAYFNVIQKTDDLSLVISHYPLVSIENEKLALAMLDQHFTFINSGSGPIGVLEEGLAASDPVSKCSSRRERAELRYGVEPLVIKSGDIVSQAIDNVSADGLFWKSQKNSVYNGEVVLLNQDVFKPEIGATVLICAYFSIVTSANLTMNTTVPLYTVKLQQLSSDEKLIDAWSGYDLRFEPGGKPINLVHRYGTIFNR